MKTIFLLSIAVSVLHFCGYAQKPVIDTSVYNKWPLLGDAIISNDGEFVSYSLRADDKTTLFVQAVHKKWKLSIPDASGAAFTAPGNRLFFMKGADSLGMIIPGNMNIRYIPGVQSFQLSNSKGYQYLAYMATSAKTGLAVQNLRNSKQLFFKDIKSFQFSPDGNMVLLLRESKDKPGEIALDRVSLADGNVITIYSGKEPNSFTFSKDGKKLCFFAKVGNDERNSIYLFKTGYPEAVKVDCRYPAGINERYSFSQILGFTRDGSGILVNFTKKERPRQPVKDAAGVDVWSYTDAELQPNQQADLGPNSSRSAITFTSFVDLNNGVIRQLSGADETLMTYAHVDEVSNLLVKRPGEGRWEEGYWNTKSKDSISAVSVKNGVRRFIADPASAALSPDGNYLVYFDTQHKDFFSIEASTGKLGNMSQAAITNCTNPVDSGYEAPRFAGWLGNDKVLLYDRNDIWEADVKGETLPVNLTNGYGLKRHIVFHLVENTDVYKLQGNSLLLCAFDQETKDNGFYSLDLFKRSDPKVLSIGPYIYYGFGNDFDFAGYFLPIKALNAKAYLVQRVSETESPNYFWTKDFKSYIPITDNHPEQVYNWLTAELVRWNTFDGSPSQGILYKPENFDPSKKYPVILHYYQKYTESIHHFPVPEYSRATLNIPEYVSNGYLVFVPDIHYGIGHPGESACNAVVSAAKYLSKLPYVDSTKIGLQGHSFGGYETYYIVTHSNIFAAAQAGDGVTDLVSSYGGLSDNAWSQQPYYDRGQGGMRDPLWERPDLFIQNSPIFYTHKVTTPILMMNNKNDLTVPFSQGVEFFTALRRMGKKAWMLQYDGQEHSLSGNASKDFTIRVRQFFEHYLKGAPAPKWMVEGIPAKMKGIDNGLELEPAGMEPGPGLLTPEQQRKVDSLQHRPPVTITIKL